MGKEDLTGRKFGRLTVIRKAEEKEITAKTKGIYWMCRCDCGKEAVVIEKTLLSGNTQSCGCYRQERAAEHMKNTRSVKAKQMQKYEETRQRLCEKYEKKCLTSKKGKCPMAKYFCYEYASVRALINEIRGDTRKNIEKTLKKAMKEQEEERV